MNINLRAVDYIKRQAAEAMRLDIQDDFIGLRIFEEVKRAFGEADYDFAPFIEELEQLQYDYSFDFMSALQRYDNIIANNGDYPSWGFDTYDAVKIDVPDLEKKADWAFIALFRSDSFAASLFLFQFLASAFLGGIDNDDTYQYLDHTPVIEAYEAFAPKAVAYILGKEYNEDTIKSIPMDIEKMVSPLDITGIPTYLLEGNPNIVMKKGRVYLKVDIAKAIAAAGGFAQALERQDLEGKLTNKAGKDEETHDRKKSRQPAHGDNAEANG